MAFAMADRLSLPIAGLFCTIKHHDGPRPRCAHAYCIHPDLGPIDAMGAWSRDEMRSEFFKSPHEHLLPSARFIEGDPEFSDEFFACSPPDFAEEDQAWLKSAIPQAAADLEIILKDSSSELSLALAKAENALAHIASL